MHTDYHGNGYFARIEERRLCLGRGEEVFFRLDPVSAADAEQKDEERALSLPEVKKDGDHWTVTWTAQSARWTKKEYIFTLSPDCATYRVRFYGTGRIETIDFFYGDRRARFYGSGYDTADYWAPLGLANAASPNRIFTMAQETHLGIGGGYSPAPTVFSFRMADADGRFALGIAATPDNCAFDGLTYRRACFAPDISRFFLQTDLGGYTEANGCAESPVILAMPADDDPDALRRWADWHYARGIARGQHGGDLPRWWRGPFFCGWKEQAIACGDGSPYDAASQVCYGAMSDTLDARGLRPSAIIIDDKWQDAYGTAMPDPAKWPDMRAFIDDQHAKGRRVALWFKSWAAEGLPDDECILSENGERLGADPTAPAYRARVREMMRTLLSDAPGCMNADGFKIDFADCVPDEKRMRIREKGVYGIALLYRLIELLYTEAKRVKPDALINTSCAHPLFAAITDQARLHDIYFSLRDSARIMKERAAMCDAVIPGISIDTDAGSCGSRRDFMRYARAAAQFGVPDLYILNPIEDCALTAQDWEEIRGIWEEYSEKIGSETA